MSTKENKIKTLTEAAEGGCDRKKRLNIREFGSFFQFFYEINSATRSKTLIFRKNAADKLAKIQCGTIILAISVEKNYNVY